MIALLMLAGACGADSDDEESSSATTAAKALGDDEQTLTVATPGDVFITRNRVLLGMWPDNANVCEPLLGDGTDLKSVPLLATRSTHVGGNTFRFELR